MKLMLKAVRIAFPNVFEAKAVNPGDTPRFSGAFIFPADHDCVAQLKQAIVSVAKDKWGAKHEDYLKAMKAKDMLCLHDGDTKADYEGYAGNLFVNAANKTKPTVIDRDRTELVPSDGKPYSGCYVNASIELWAQDNNFGKRVNASLRGVQFFDDGERLSGGGVASEDEFDAIPSAGGEGTAETVNDIF